MCIRVGGDSQQGVPGGGIDDMVPLVYSTFTPTLTAALLGMSTIRRVQ